MRVKALTLLEGSKDDQLIAIDLLRRLVAEYGDDPVDGPTAPEYLGRSYELVGRPAQAATWYEVAVDRQRNSNVYGLAPFRLADVVVRAQLSEHYERTLAILQSEPFPWLGMNWHAFERAKSIAFLAHRLGDSAEARRAADEALDLAMNRTKPEFPRHPTVGLIEADDPTLAELRSLATPA
jgi:hypothetical protein